MDRKIVLWDSKKQKIRTEPIVKVSGVWYSVLVHEGADGREKIIFRLRELENTDRKNKTNYGE